MDARGKPGHDRAMNWISNVVRPKIRSFLRRETPENLWIKCPETGQLVFYKDVEANQFVIPSSNYHMRISAPARLKSVFDNGEYEDLLLPDVPVDPLRFRDERRYADRLKDARTKTGLQDAVKVGVGMLEGLRVTIGVQDFDFMGGSLGMAAGEAFIKGVETAVQRETPFIMFAASGGARNPAFTNTNYYEVTGFRRYSNTVEGDYQLSSRFGFHLGWRYAKRRIELFGFTQTLPPATPPTRTIDGPDSEENQTNTIIAGFKAKPLKNWTIFGDFERGDADKQNRDIERLAGEEDQVS